MEYLYFPNAEKPALHVPTPCVMCQPSMREPKEDHPSDPINDGPHQCAPQVLRSCAQVKFPKGDLMCANPRPKKQLTRNCRRFHLVDHALNRGVFLGAPSPARHRQAIKQFSASLEPLSRRCDNIRKILAQKPSTLTMRDSQASPQKQRETECKRDKEREFQHPGVISSHTHDHATRARRTDRHPLVTL